MKGFEAVLFSAKEALRFANGGRFGLPPMENANSINNFSIHTIKSDTISLCDLEIFIK